ncbi:MAG: hypothetical protein J7574_08970 [Flavobacterium sp.]|nr:hypothetical protein [Flavobacterium sp.]MBO9584277.1 hypothetical protein [Flavobacterium sp.]
MNAKEKKEMVKTLEQLLEETETKKKALLKIVQKLSKAAAKNQKPK